MPSAIIYVVVMQDGTPLPNLTPIFSLSIPFVSVNGKGNPPQRTTPDGAIWFMGVQQGTVITVSAPAFTSIAVTTTAPDGSFNGTNLETPLVANLQPFGHRNLQQVNAGGKTNRPVANSDPFASVFLKGELHVFYLDSAFTIWDSYYQVVVV